MAPFIGYGFVNNPPPGYTRLNYLESTGTQYLDLNFLPDNTSGIEVQFSFGSQRINQMVLGSNGPGASRFAVGVDSSGSYPGINLDFNYYYQYPGQVLTIYVACINFLNDRTLRLDNVVKVSNLPALNPNSYRMLMFGCRWNSNAFSYPFYGKIYNCKLSRDNTVVHHYIPCLNSDGKPCMYDLISRTAFYNQGTGEFLYG